MRRPLLLALLPLAFACGDREPPATAILPAKPLAGQTEIPYPSALYARGVEGEVLLYLVVDSAGGVIRDSTRIAKSSGYAEFDAAAMEAAPGIRFSPTLHDSLPVTAPIQAPRTIRSVINCRVLTSQYGLRFGAGFLGGW